MTIYFYDMIDDPRTMPKNMQNETTKTGSVRGEIDMIRPVIDVEGSAFSQNYAYIPDFNRYYYVDNVRILRTGICTLTLRVDVLQSFYSEIVNAPMIAERSENVFNTFIADPERKFYQYTLNQYIDIGDVGIPNTPILVTVG